MNEVAASALRRIEEKIPGKLRDTLLLRLFGLWKVPLLAHVRPIVDELTHERCVVRIPLTRRTQNHVGSLYFGVLAIGADAAGGLIAMQAIREKGGGIGLLFKDLHADFLARAEGDTCFTCADGAAIRAAVERTLTTGQRENIPVNVIATVPDKLGERPAARFTLTLSLKRQ